MPGCQWDQSTWGFMSEFCGGNRAEAYLASVLPADVVPLAVMLVQLPLEKIEMRGRMVGQRLEAFLKRLQSKSGIGGFTPVSVSLRLA